MDTYHTKRQLLVMLDLTDAVWNQWIGWYLLGCIASNTVVARAICATTGLRSASNLTSPK